MVSVLETVRQNNVRMLSMLMGMSKTLSSQDVEMGLFHAVRYGLSECLTCLLTCSISRIPEMRDGAGNSAVHVAVAANKPECLQQLINSGCDINLCSSSQNTPLHVAARFGFEECLTLLISKKADLDAKDSTGATPLILAARSKQYDAVRCLLQAGCNPNAVDNKGRCALHFACQMAAGYNPLLQAGASPDIVDQDGYTPLFLAAAEGFDNVVKALAQAGCDVSLTKPGMKTTALHVLARKGHGDCIPDLVMRGADVYHGDEEGCLPLWHAIDNHRVDAVRVLLQCSDPLTAPPCPGREDTHLCPAYLALLRAEPHMLKLLLSSGYDSRHVREAFESPDVETVFAEKGDEHLSHWQEEARRPLHLKELCRLVIRHLVGVKECLQGAESLPLPSSARTYLKMEELEHVH